MDLWHRTKPRAQRCAQEAEAGPLEGQHGDVARALGSAGSADVAVAHSQHRMQRTAPRSTARRSYSA
jgi:hypothetical protein